MAHSLADRRVAGGFGIMIDDVMAGVYAWSTMHLWFWPLVKPAHQLLCLLCCTPTACRREAFLGRLFKEIACARNV